MFVNVNHTKLEILCTFPLNPHISKGFQCPLVSILPASQERELRGAFSTCQLHNVFHNEIGLIAVSEGGRAGGKNDFRPQNYRLAEVGELISFCKKAYFPYMYVYIPKMPLYLRA